MLDHHRRRLDDRGGGHALLEAELLDGIPRHHRDQPDRVADDHLDLRHQPLDLDVGDDCVEAVARAQVCGARLTAQPVDLARRDDAPVVLVALGPDPALPVPAAQRVDADPEGLRGFADAVELPRHVFNLPMQGLGRKPFGGCAYLMIVKLFVLLAVPAGLVTVIAPVFALTGTVIVSFVPDTTLNLAGTPLNVTDVVPLRFVPLRETEIPGFPLVIESFVIVGTGAVIGRKPYLSIVAWPCLLSTLSMNACAAALFWLRATMAIA